MDSIPAPQRFMQEVAIHAGLTNSHPSSAIQLLDLDANGSLRFFNEGRWQAQTNSQWIDTSLPGLAISDSSFSLPGTGQLPLPWRSVKQVLRRENRIWIQTDEEVFAVENQDLHPLQCPGGKIQQTAIGARQEIYVAAEKGFFHWHENQWQRLTPTDGVGRVWGNDHALGIACDRDGSLWIATRAGIGCQKNGKWTFYEGRDGVPWTDFTGIAASPDGSIWFGTRLGAIHFEAGEWHYRQGPRWLPGDEVRSVLIDARGAAWFSTDKGLGCIRHEPMTLAEKAAFYESEIARYLKRTPYGYVAEAALKTPPLKETAEPEDTDNDGLWTGMYGAGECFAWAATRDPAARERARQAFEALRFLQKVTQTGSNIPPKGFVARTIRSTDQPDPNIGRLESDRRDHEQDSQWKVYEPRWPRTADGRWFWKSDTSSDELDGHYFFYSVYYELCADTPGEKERVGEVVRDLTDHLMNHGFTLTDHDGTHTRWAVFGPQYLNADPHWWPERGLNSLSCLSYLGVASQVTGDPKYEAAAQELIDKHGYGQNIMYPKLQLGPGSGNQSDDEMAFMCFYTLLRHTRNEALKQQLSLSLFGYWINEAPEMNPFFNFTLAAFIPPGATSATAPAPWPGWLDDSMATLRGFPLDRRNWPHRNSHRLDLVLLDAQQSENVFEGKRDGRARRVNGKVIPVENRHFNHWNTDPWQLDYGGSGNELAPGTVFLLPYYMGLYHGFIEKP